MSAPEDDADLEAHLRQFRLVAAPGVDVTLQRARRDWDQHPSARGWAWMLPYAAAAMVILDLGYVQVIGHASSGATRPSDIAAVPVDTASQNVAAAPVAADPAISLSMLEHHVDPGP